MLVEQHQRPGEVIEKSRKIHRQTRGAKNNNMPEMTKPQDVIAVPLFISLSNLSSQQPFRFCLYIKSHYLIKFSLSCAGHCRISDIFVPAGPVKKGVLRVFPSARKEECSFYFLH